MTRVLWLAACIATVGCEKHDAPTPPPPAPSPQAATTSTPKVADPHFRELLAAIADARACQQVRHSFHGLRSSASPDTVTGELWIRDCDIAAHGTRLRFHFAGDGWQRVDRTTKKFGATFTVNEYVRFHVDATIHGVLDLAYAPASHIATIWFQPTKPPEVKFEPIGKVDVDERGLWSEIIGSIASAVGKAPEKEARKQVAQEGQESFASKLDDGMTVTVNACTGSARSQFGLLEPGKEAPLDVGDTTSVEVELRKGGVLLFGPEYAAQPVSIEARTSKGPVRVQVACLAEAEKAARAYAAGEPLPNIQTLADAEISGTRRLAFGKPSCPFALLAQSEGGTVSLRWKRHPPPGASLIDCPQHQRDPETQPHAQPTPQNTPATPGPHGH